MTTTTPWQRRVDGGDWAAITTEIDECGGAHPVVRVRRVGLLLRLVRDAAQLIPVDVSVLDIHAALPRI